jgi:hypothetical protein
VLQIFYQVEMAAKAEVAVFPLAFPMVGRAKAVQALVVLQAAEVAGQDSILAHLLVLVHQAVETAEPMMAQVLQELPIQAVAVAVLAQVVVVLQVAQVVQVMHELLIGVNYGTTLCIS